MEHSVEAQVIDSRHLKLKKPIKLAPGSTVMITIESAEGVADDQEWYLLSSQGLEEAYSENEPDFDELITSQDSDFAASGLVSDSLIRLGFLAVLPRRNIIGSIGSISTERHKRLLCRLSEYLVKAP